MSRPVEHRGQQPSERSGKPSVRPVALVMAKVPVPGQVKTRLAATVGTELAARLAHAALLDTMSVCEEAFGPARCFIALAGDLDELESDTRGELRGRLRRWRVLPQRGLDFGERLERAHTEVHQATDAAVVQVGMDTPHLDGSVLVGVSAIASGRRPLLGMAVDGGWWVLASTAAEDVEGLAQVPLSTPATGADTLALLRARGREVVLGPRMRDVDDYLDAAVAARLAPHTRFATVWNEIAASRSPGWAS